MAEREIRKYTLPRDRSSFYLNPWMIAKELGFDIGQTVRFWKDEQDPLSQTFAFEGVSVKTEPSSPSPAFDASSD